MTSSMLAGERRWASARRGGMTVLGKVAVPKPINLPSQRLEKHGLDPNVEIVPKGSHSWGSRPSSSASNPWGSSVPSPSGECSNGSPSHAAGRPSSGGSGTRPSTAGSDRMHEPFSSAWGSNSRPSSASGASTSNHTSLTPLRPQSAETRPGSSQLSRFAEHLPDNSASWTSTGNVDKLVVASTKNDGFSLSSGDFPTLGSERDSSGKNFDSQDYGSRDRPRSSSGEVAAANDRTVTSESVGKGANTNTWKRDDTQHAEDGVEPNSNNWQGGYPQHFLNMNVPPQHFDAWRGPPVNSPATVWYRGPPGGPPYGPPVAPGGFPVEPFPYYRPQMPPPTMGNSQPVPQQVPVAGPRGHHPRNGDLYRPQMPDGYMHPGMPIRPGFYPRPVPYDNYYGAPMGYNPNERDIPFMGRSSAPPAFNRYPAQNTPDHINTHARAGGSGPNATTSISEQVESGNIDNSRGPYKVLMKQHNDIDAQGEEGSWENIPHGNIFFPEKEGQPRAAFRKNEWGSDSRREEMHSRRTAPGEYSSSRKFDNRGNPSNSARIMSPERINHVDRNWGTKLETASARSSFPEVPHVLTAPPKDSALLQKIEGLNAKARASDGRQEVASAYSREEEKNMAQFDAISNTSKNDVGTAVLCAERPNSRDTIHSSSGAPVSKGHMIRQSNAGTTNSRRGNNGVEGQFEHRGKGRVNADADGWPKKPLGAECSTDIPTTNVRPVSIAHNQDHLIHAEASGMTETSLPANKEGESLVQIFDSSDTQAERAKRRESAKQRAIQLQKEEEERIREQKAKALAKLEELNRRSQTVDVLTEKSEKAPPISGMIVSHEELQTLAEPVKIAPENEGSNPVLASSSEIVAFTTESCTSRAPEGTVGSKNLHMGTSETSELVTTAPQSSPLRLDSAGAAVTKALARVNDSSSSKNLQTSYKKTPNIQVDKQFSETLISFGTIGLTNIHESVTVDGTAISETVPEAIVPSCLSTLSENTNTVSEFSAAQKKKSSKSGKNKNKLENPTPVSDSQLLVSEQPSSNKAFLETGKMKASQSTVNPGSVQAVEDLEQLSEQNSLIGDDSHVKVNNYRKSQPPRRMSRNGQANKVADRSHGNEAAIWAPVQSHHRSEAADEACRKLVPDSVAVTAKSGNLGQNSVKSKRAEMERYVPKPVAKELAQQVTIQQSVSSSFGQNTLNETAGRRESRFQESSQPARSVVENVGRAMESDAGDIKQSKQAKAYGGWKQHGSTESACAHMGSSSNLNKNTHKYMAHQESLIPDENQVLFEPNISHDWDPSDGWNMPEEPTAAVNVSFGMIDVVKGKGKRQPYKGHKNMANKHDVDQKNSDGGEMYIKQIQSAVLQISQPERNVTTKENRGNGERTSSLWQPKPQAYSGNAQTGSRSSGGQHISAESGQVTRKGPNLVIGDASVTLDKDHSDVTPQLHLGQSLSKNKSVESTNVVHQEGKRTKKVALAKERVQLHHKHGLGSMDELAPPESEDTRFEQRSSSGFRKHGNQNYQSGRGQEPREDWSSVWQDSRRHSVTGNRERQPRNSHYEYQPVGPHDHSKFNSFEGTDGSHNTGSRYRERGQGQSRRGGGNSYGRKSGAVQVDAGCD